MAPQTARTQQSIERWRAALSGGVSPLSAAAPVAYHYAAAAIDAPAIPSPTGLRAPFGWPTFAVAASDTGMVTRLVWSDSPGVTGTPTRLRLTVALDVREEKRIEAHLAHSGRSLGEFDIRFAYPLQPFELPLAPANAAEVAREGVALRMRGGEQPLWLLAPADGTRDVPTALSPHLLVEAGGDPIAAFCRLLISPASLQPFGWLEGCVLEGLLALARRGHPEARDAARHHLDRFRDHTGALRYEGPRGAPADEAIYGIEGTLPFAALARLQPEAPALDTAIDFWMARAADGVTIRDGGSLTAEGSYTVAYPLAVAGTARGRDDLRELALEQLRARRRLVTDSGLDLRVHDDGRRTFHNWGRAYAWYLLGLTGTLATVGERVDCADLREECRRVAAIALGHQRADGLWSCFLDDPTTNVDTSASAGIAAALANGAATGLLPISARQAAERALIALTDSLTPDGFLSGVAQVNRGGEALQRSDYRVLSQMAMGLLAQLAATIVEPTVDRHAADDTR